MRKIRMAFILIIPPPFQFFFFFFNDTATTEIYTLSLHDALPILVRHVARVARTAAPGDPVAEIDDAAAALAPHVLRGGTRLEEHTSELQSQSNLVCRLLLEKKKKVKFYVTVVENTVRLLTVAIVI